MTRALTAITALQMGISGTDGVAAALHQLYEAARRTVLDSAMTFDSPRIETLRTDFSEIALAMRG